MAFQLVSTMLPTPERDSDRGRIREILQCTPPPTCAPSLASGLKLTISQQTNLNKGHSRAAAIRQIALRERISSETLDLIAIRTYTAFWTYTGDSTPTLGISMLSIRELTWLEVSLANVKHSHVSRHSHLIIQSSLLSLHPCSYMYECTTSIWTPEYSDIDTQVGHRASWCRLQECASLTRRLPHT